MVVLYVGMLGLGWVWFDLLDFMLVFVVVMLVLVSVIVWNWWFVKDVGLELSGYGVC